MVFVAMTGLGLMTGKMSVVRKMDANYGPPCPPAKGIKIGKLFLKTN